LERHRRALAAVETAGGSDAPGDVAALDAATLDESRPRSMLPPTRTPFGGDAA
jgi:hypothetical protein